jgi:hypothetical protein
LPSSTALPFSFGVGRETTPVHVDLLLVAAGVGADVCTAGALVVDHVGEELALVAGPASGM